MAEGPSADTENVRNPRKQAKRASINYIVIYVFFLIAQIYLQDYVEKYRISYIIVFIKAILTVFRSYKIETSNI